MALRIVVISDTHTLHSHIEMPEGDVLICCGDITFKGQDKAVQDFVEWFGKQSHRHKVAIMGNHELGWEHRTKEATELFAFVGVHYLEQSSVVIDGVRFYGDPRTPFFHNWEWNVSRGEELAKHWAKIPNDTDILITHGPPYKILDWTSDDPRDPFGDNVGCEELRKRIKQLNKLNAHCFGHIHSNYGSMTKDGVLFVNASICTNKYAPINKPIVFDIESKTNDKQEKQEDKATTPE